MPIQASDTTSTYSGVLQSMARSARRKEPEPSSKSSHEKAWNAVELTIGKTRKLSVSRCGNASRPPTLSGKLRSARMPWLLPLFWLSEAYATAQM